MRAYYQLGIWLALAAGLSWVQTGIDGSSIHPLFASDADGAGSSAAVSSVSASEDYWVYTNGPGAGNDVRSFAVDSKGRVLAGTWSSGGTVWRTSDNGSSWIQLGTIPNGDPVMGLCVDSRGHIFACVITKGVFRSTDDGASWQLKNNGLSNLRVRGNLVGKNGFVWVASEGGVFRSSDNGESWVSQVAGNFAVVFLDSAGAIVTQDPSSIYRSTNGGSSWTVTPMSIGVGVGTVHPDGTYIGCSSKSAIYRSTDKGVTWDNLNNPYALAGYTCALICNVRGDIFYAKDGNNGGVVLSTDMGATWTVVNSGLTTKRVIPLLYHPNGYVYGGTNGSGVFRTRVATQPVPNKLVPPWKCVNTGISHTIILPNSANPNIDGTPLSTGDYVGVFYDSSGTLVCAGYERWGGSGSIAVSAFGDDPTSGAKDGFAAQETFQWRMFRAGEGTVYDAEATYAPSAGVVTHTSTYVPNGISQLSSLVRSNVTQCLVLRAGWSLVAGYVTPTHLSLDSIFNPVLHELIIVKNGVQKAFIPSVQVNTIGLWMNTQGYQVKMVSARSLCFAGPRVVPSVLTIGLPRGWSILPYVRDIDMPIVSALSGVVGDVVIVKDQDGKAYIPSVGVNGIHTLRVGQAYQIRMSNSCAIKYPAESAISNAIENSSPMEGRHTNAVSSPWFYNNTGVSHSIIIPTNVNPVAYGAPLMAGDYVGAFYDSVGTLACGGLEAWSGTDPIAVPVFGDDPTTAVKDGFTAGETLQWKVWRQSDSHSFTAKVSYVTPGGLGGIVTDAGIYNPNGISAVLTLAGILASSNTRDIPTHYSFTQEFPHPFIPGASMSFGLPARCWVRLTVSDISGKQVAELVNGDLEAGYHQVYFDGKGLASGVYFCRIDVHRQDFESGRASRSGEGLFGETRKLLLLRY